MAVVTAAAARLDIAAVGAASLYRPLRALKEGVDADDLLLVFD